MNETNLAYDVRPCAYENFATWTAPAFQNTGTWTTNGGWTISGGAISNDATRSLVAVLDGTGSTATNFIQSPLLTNGLGQITFWYRNAATNGNPASSLSIQAAPSTNSASWKTLSTLTNIHSATYLFASIPLSDLDNQCLRILNLAAGTNTRVWLDDIVIAAPGPGVQASSPTNSPANPSVWDPVDISIDLTPKNGASITNVTAWYWPFGNTNLTPASIPMTLSNGHYITTAPIPRTQGTNQYFVQYYFTGYQAISPAISATNT